jgi:hypothetical protein
MNVRGKIRVWYEGTFVPYENDPDDLVVFIGGAYRRHWTAKIARAITQFWLDHWQWAIGTVLAICGMAIALLKH